MDVAKGLSNGGSRVRKAGEAGKTGQLMHELGRTVPQAIDVEEAVLGALLQQRDALSAVLDILKPDSFYKEAHKRIYTAIIDLFNLGQEIDILTVAEQLRKKGELEFAGGTFALSYLTSVVNSAANIEYHARIVAEKAIKRELIRVSGEINRDAWEEGSDVFELMDSAEQKLFQIAEANITKNYARMEDVVRDVLKELEHRKLHQDELSGVPSGLANLDRLTNGWQPSDLIIIAARPAMGKTAFALSIARNAAVKFGRGVAIFSLEMSANQLAERFFSQEAEITSEQLRKGNLDQYQWRNLVQKADNLAKAPLFIDDTSSLSVLELRAKCRRLKAQHDISMVVIDYLQLMKADLGKNNSNREQEIAHISRSLKGLAKELNIPIICLAQLSRAVEQRSEKKPQLSDLRESGSIEQDADMVGFLYRPEYYGIEADESGPTQGVGYVIIGKNRHGQLDEVRLRFRGEFTRFEDMDADPLGSFGDMVQAKSAMSSMGGIPSEFDLPGGSDFVTKPSSFKPGFGNPDDLRPIDDTPF